MRGGEKKTQKYCQRDAVSPQKEVIPSLTGVYTERKAVKTTSHGDIEKLDTTQDLAHRQCPRSPAYHFSLEMS